MNTVLEKINNYINQNEQSINDKIVGINYLEQLKYLIINDLATLDENIFKDALEISKENKAESNFFEFNTRSLNLSIKFIKESVSKIKTSINEDTLSIVAYGLKNITIVENKNIKKSVSLNLYKNMGVVLSQNTLVSEKIASGSIILDINSNKNILDIEKK
ncbi:MAG: hypothetical protein CFH16_00773 [Alphaproteobacteria bacterium MarineAlpha5_Bin6]|nr:MAG: hypothetical protein CFH17_01276 [Alphaproteobacteria bacterium MarineAlpha5_Bin7]PPR53848.1 MAG: hypothetical protein CFH16_00773 [Alphaproteobacteria bacterium MarineAlpha5_Bin6]|tara:strand:+ start:1326 stop:1808 length:483 start_codon:yes stop_codon:yes gene_type:complete